MAREDVELLAFNRGMVSRLALARGDIKRVAMSAEIQTNFIPRVLGPMSLRPGYGYVGNSRTNLKAFYLPFIFATDDTALIELTGGKMRVRVEEALVTRPAVSTTITNGSFTTDLSGWTDNDQVGATSVWATGGYMSLLGTGAATAIRDQALSISAPDQNVQHAINIEVTRGEVILRVGSSTGASDYIAETTLRPGKHSLAFTPTGATANIRLMGRLTYASLVTSCTMAATGVMEVDTYWTEAQLPLLRARQSGDVIFIACKGVLQARIERRGNNSWSVVEYVANGGPFRVGNTSSITMVPSALNGTITLTASEAFFKATNVNGLLAIDSTGQAVTRAISAADVYTDPIRVTGIGSGRTFAITITGTWTATVTLQRSVGAPGAWVDVSNYTVNQSTTLSDTLDNQIIYYRIGIKPGNYTSGTATAGLGYAAGSIRGVARIVGFTSETVVDAVVVKDFGALTATTDWLEGAWSPRRGYPTSVGIYEGRVWWAGSDKINGSVSDEFANYDDSVTGDSAPISRSIGAGPVDTINWLLEAQQLVLGAQGAELVCRSTSLGEPLTVNNFNLKEATSRGSLGVDAVKVDTSAIYVDRSGARIYEMEYDNVGSTYSGVDLTSIIPEIGQPGVVRIGVQRRADTRLHFIRSDGTVALLVYDKAEDVKAWVVIETDGVVEDVVVLPGTEEDKVYYSIKRVINGSTVRFLERWALQSECVGGDLNKQADAYVVYNGVSTNTVTGLAHLEGETVVVWADGVDYGTQIVAGGAVSITDLFTKAVVGLGYTARYKSVKAKNLTKRKKIDKIGLVLLDTHPLGIRYGQDFDHLDDLPYIQNGVEIDLTGILDDFDFDDMEVNGVFDTNSRLCLEAAAPRPCTVAACIMTVTVNDK